TAANPERGRPHRLIPRSPGFRIPPTSRSVRSPGQHTVTDLGAGSGQAQSLNQSWRARAGAGRWRDVERASHRSDFPGGSAMRLPRITTRRWMLAVLVFSVILATAGRWIASGCPVGFCCGSCQTSLGGRAIVASSDHLLTNISLVGDKDSALLDVEGRKVVVRGSEVAVDGTTRCLIRSGCMASDSNGEKTNDLQDDGCSGPLSQTMVIENPQDLRSTRVISRVLDYR